jgi:hypothetical protein
MNLKQEKQKAGIVFKRPNGEKILITEKDKEFLMNWKWDENTKKSLIEILWYINLVHGIK